MRAPDPTKLLTGPAGGLFENVGKVAGGLNDYLHGKTVANSAKRAATHLLPCGVQELLNYFVAPPMPH